LCAILETLEIIVMLGKAEIVGRRPEMETGAMTDCLGIGLLFLSDPMLQPMLQELQTIKVVHLETSQWRLLGSLSHHSLTGTLRSIHSGLK
jgi:hypothetical protein